MKISVQPGKRQNGTPRLIFDGELALSEITTGPLGGVVLSVLCTDIYTPRASQRYSIALDVDDLDAIQKVIGVTG
jgi:hypothetical protein